MVCGLCKGLGGELRLPETGKVLNVTSAILIFWGLCWAVLIGIVRKA